MAKIVADQLVEMLVQAGVKRVYAVTGDSLNFFNEAIRKDGRIKWIHVRHEEVGAYAAAAEAELDGIACCAGSCGPGHVHLINGMYDAHKSHVPMLVIASTINTHEMGMDYFQETNTIKLFDDCSCYNQLITTAEQAPRIIQTAIQHAISKKGVAVIGLPGDVSELKAVDTETSTQIFRCNPTIRPSEDELLKLANLINSSRCTTIYCGIGAEGAHEQVVQLSHHLKAPVGYSFRGKMGIQHHNPNEIGMTGLLGMPSAYQSMHDSDLVILLGTDFPYENFMPVDNKIIQIDTNAERLGRRAKLDLGLIGDIKDTIVALLPLLNEKLDDSFLKSQLDFYEKVKENMHTYINAKGDEDTIQPEYLAHIIDTRASEDAIFTVDTGMTCVWGARFITATGKRKMLGSFNHGSMANAMPMAIGAALAYPDRQVIAMCGDGGLSMLLGDLATIRQYNIPVKIVVFNNRSLGMVKLEMQVTGLMDNETDMINPDFAMIAEAMGFRGITVRNPDEVSGAIDAALLHPGPVLLNVFTNPSALAMPPKVNLDQMFGMAKSMTKLMLGGKMQEVFDTIKSNYKHLKEL
ncbi:thiamine pyrophosphate-dependent enzyme [Sphingobacterium spiritivorum]|uniref:Thiamine pyrophosphate enzyme, C-terminal TPP binding domain protein n=1 Tax=Sphingobacterium spiritivorum ATCC 33861 TaxID=525373 RepID=D7VPG2_SPHSI|nr:thiamine pyrophosphate-dependent enzyme [Sphingobacterium spiritivorum]EFK57809.1 thiamine pyrophosphate enzyme, C-terminal TPP binding domain protein [Sphingobacterium spiritivorum ATCC 33861]QQT36162.1 pyruvate oxidase [Sphingobacterium spiritivorum]WQD32899.1 thiamine pyrophosphate-binding protein [Sphingobacterium spiritivorum]SUJ16294.1 Pyruvate dehydrogenase [ubiquinone] [Sphingobacterium spiritivorum]